MVIKFTNQECFVQDGIFRQDRDIFNISSVRRNPVIADLFARMNLMERRGSGLKKIVEAYESEEKYNEGLIPEFRSTETAFFTVLKNLNYKEINVGQNVGESVVEENSLSCNKLQNNDFTI